MAGQNIYELSLPDVPASLNRVGSRGRSHWAWTNEKKKWEGLIGIGLMQAKVPRGLMRVEATAILRFPTKRRRDEGNFRTMLEKALGDILVSGGWLPDDDPDCFSFRELSFDSDKGPAETRIRLKVEWEELDEAA